MFCPKCGSQVNSGAKFCNVCGEPMRSVTPASQATFHQASTMDGWGSGGVIGAEITNRLGVLGVVKGLFCIIVLTCMAMPWFRFSMSTVVDSLRELVLQYNYSDSIPDMKNLYLSVIGVAENASVLGSLGGWISRFDGAEAVLSELGALEKSVVLLRLFSLLWFISLVLLVIGFSLSVLARQGDAVLRVSLVMCATTSVVGIVFALIAAKRYDDALVQAMSTLGDESLRLVLGQFKGVFGFTLAPFGVLIASVFALTCSLARPGRKTDADR